MDLKTYISGQRGRAKSLAEKIGISPSFLSQITAGTAPASPSRCLAIEKATGGQVTRQDLRKSDWQDIWPELKAVERRGDADAQRAGRPGRQPPSPHNILDTVPEGAVVSPIPPSK